VLHIGSNPLDSLSVLRELRAGSIVAIQLDRPAPSRRELEVELFGRRVRVPEGPFRLAALARTPIVPLFARRRAHFDYELTVFPSIELEAAATVEELTRAAQAATSAMAEFLARSPTQWFNF
jgi:lauroyl/myristoyl acyltransferase